MTNTTLKDLQRAYDRARKYTQYLARLEREWSEKERDSYYTTHKAIDLVEANIPELDTKKKY